jgi:hypothetical protein
LKGCRVLIASKQAFKNVGEIDDMLFEAAFVVWAKMVIADNGQDGGGSLTRPAFLLPGADADR